jgi:hypothetical protein
VVAASKEFLAKSLVNDNYGGITIEFWVWKRLTWYCFIQSYHILLAIYFCI